jgi:hypothetical protein
MTRPMGVGAGADQVGSGGPPAVYPIRQPCHAGTGWPEKKPEQAHVHPPCSPSAPHGYVPPAGTFDAWATWQLKLGARLKDRGNVAFSAAQVGAGAAAPP